MTRSIPVIHTFKPWLAVNEVKSNKHGLNYIIEADAQALVPLKNLQIFFLLSAPVTLLVMMMIAVVTLLLAAARYLYFYERRTLLLAENRSRRVQPRVQIQIDCKNLRLPLYLPAFNSLRRVDEEEMEGSSRSRSTEEDTVSRPIVSTYGIYEKIPKRWKRHHHLSYHPSWGQHLRYMNKMATVETLLKQKHRHHWWQYWHKQLRAWCVLSPLHRCTACMRFHPCKQCQEYQGNTVNMRKNILDACGDAVGFWTIGYAFAYGGADSSKITPRRCPRRHSRGAGR